MKITPLGDSALVVHVCETSVDPDDKSLRAVLDALQRINDARIPGIVELAPGYTTIGVFFDPLRVKETGVSADKIFESIAEQIGEAVSRRTRKTTPPANRLIEIPVCYDPDFALDLDEVAGRSGLSPKEVVDLHTGASYRVHCVGFTPGFPYLSGLPARLATPRRATPRKEIPAGSVAIGGNQTGVYPIKSPGGWNVIGRTPLRLFDPATNPPALLRAGDYVRFRSVTRLEFEQTTKQ